MSQPLLLASPGFTDTTGATAGLLFTGSNNVWAGPITISGTGVVGAYNATGTISGNFAGGGALVFGTGAAAAGTAETIILTGNSNAWSGGTTIQNFTTVDIGASNTSGILSPNTTGVLLNGTNSNLNYDRTDTTTWTQSITGTGNVGVRKGGTLVLGVSEGYSGVTSVFGGGILRPAADNVLPSASVVSLGSGTTVGTLDLSTTTQTIEGLSANSNSTAANAITLGGILTVSGNVSVGTNQTTTDVTKLVFTGGGTFTMNPSTFAGSLLNVGNPVQSAGNVDSATLDMTGLSVVNIAAATIRIGDLNGNNSTTVAVSLGADILSLAPTSTLSATTLSIGGEAAWNLDLPLNFLYQTLNLGSNVNVFNIDTINVGGFNIGANNIRGNGVLHWTAPTGTLSIAGRTSSSAVLNMVNTSSGTGNSMNAVVDFGSHTVTGSLSSLTMAARSGGSTTAGIGSSAILNFGAGALNIGTLVMSSRTNATTASVSSTINVTGGALTIGTAQLGNNTINTAAAVASLNISGGTVTMGGDLVVGSTTGPVTRSLTLSGGVLDLGGHSIGSASTTIPTTITAGTLKNLNEFNGGAVLTKSGSGILTLAGVNSYTGNTLVSGGTLLVDGVNVGAGFVTIPGNATLGGIGSIAGTANVAGHVAPGDVAPGTLTTGNISFGNGSALDIQLFGPTLGTGAGNYDQLNVNGTVNLDSGGTGGAILNVNLGTYGPAPNSTFTIVNNDSNDPINGLFQTPGNVPLNEGDTFNAGLASFRISYVGGDGNDVVLTVLTSTPPVVYVSSSNFGLGSPPAPGQMIDGDQGTSGTQAAVYGFNAFSSIAAALAAVAPGGTIVVNAGSYAESPNLVGAETLQLTGGAITLNELDGASGTFVDLQGNALTLGQSNAGNHTIASVIKDTATGGTLTKVGTDTLTLSGASTFAGATTVSAGSLLVTGSLTSPVAVATAATLGGSGAVGNVSSVGSNSGTVNPGIGSADGTLTVGSFILGTGTLFLNIDGPSTYDSVKVAGSTINLTGTNLTLAIAPANINTGDQYTILSNPGNLAITGSFVGAAEGGTITVSGKSFAITYHGGASGHDVVLTAQAGGAVTIVNGFPALNANPHNLPQYSYIAHPGQHSMIESVVYSFSSSVSLSRTDFTITNKGPANIGGSNFATYVPDLVVTGTDNNTLWTVTFANHVIGGAEQPDGVSDTTGSIGDGKYELVLNAASGLTSTYDYYRLLGDVNHKATVDGDNFQAFITAFNQTPGTALYVGAFDFDGGYLNPTVNGADFQTLVTNFNHTVGDITGFN